MRNLFKKSLTLCLVAILAFSCFAGIVSAETAYTATIAVVDQTITQGTTSVDVTLNITSSQIGINEALIEVSSDIGTINSKATLDEPTAAIASIELPEGSTNYGSFYLSAKNDISGETTVLGSIATASITVTFTVDENKAVGTYPINIKVDGVRAASGNEDVITFTYATANVTVAEPHVHKYTYTPNGDKTHNGACTCGEDAITNEACVDGDDEDTLCDKCNFDLAEEEVCEHENATKTVREVTETKFIYDLDCPDCDEENLTLEVNVNNNEISGNKVSRTIKPGNDIALWFMFKKEQQVGYTDLCLVIEKEVYEFGANEPNEEKAIYYLTDPIDGYNSSGVLCDTFAFDKLAAYEMGNVVSVKLYGYSAAQEMQLLKTTTYSISQFLTTKISGGGEPALMKVYVDILNYGAASQQLADILMNTDDLVNATLTEAQKAYGTPVEKYCDTHTEFVDAAKSAVYNTESPVGYVTPVTTISPESKVNIYFKYRVVSKDGTETYFTGDVNNLYCRYYYTDVMGVDQIVDFHYDGLMRDGLNAFKFDLQPIAQLDKPVKAVVYYGDPNEASSYQIMEKEYSIESFIKSKIGSSTTEVKAVLQTMYAYGYSLKYCVENGLV